MTSRYLYESTAFVELVLIEPSMLGLLSVRSPGGVSLCKCGKFHQRYFQDFEGGVMGTRPLKASSRSFHYVFELLVTFCYVITYC